MSSPVLSSPSQKNNIFTKQIGKNGHDEYGWSEYTKERIVQFNYQLVRTSKEYEIIHLADILYNIINAKIKPNINTIFVKNKFGFFDVIILIIDCIIY